jgi:hypothetical protein
MGLMRVVLCVIGLSLLLTGCSGAAGSSARAPRSIDTTATLRGIWIPRTKGRVLSLQFDGTRITQVLDGSKTAAILRNGRMVPVPTFTNRGSWRVAGPDTLYFELDTLGFGVLTGTYRYALTPNALTLGGPTGDAWVTGSDVPTLTLDRKR